MMVSKNRLHKRRQRTRNQERKQGTINGLFHRLVLSVKDIVDWMDDDNTNKNNNDNESIIIEQTKKKLNKKKIDDDEEETTTATIKTSVLGTERTQTSSSSSQSETLSSTSIITTTTTTDAAAGAVTIQDLYVPIKPLSEETRNAFWSTVPSICDPRKAVLNDNNSSCLPIERDNKNDANDDNDDDINQQQQQQQQQKQQRRRRRELASDIYHDEKYRKKLIHQTNNGGLSAEQATALYNRHGKKRMTVLPHVDDDVVGPTAAPPAASSSSTDIVDGGVDVTDDVTTATTTTAARATTTTASTTRTNQVSSISLLSTDRGQRKAWQVENFVSLLQDRLTRTQSTSSMEDGTFTQNGGILTVVDFGCGSGNLCLALAAYFPTVRFVLVDKKPYPLQLAKQRAIEANLTNVQVVQYQFSPSNLHNFAIPPPRPSSSPTSSSQFCVVIPEDREKDTPPSLSENDDNHARTGTAMLKRRRRTTPSLTKQHGGTTNTIPAAVSSSSSSFDIGIGLHCCGSFTDMVMTLCRTANADCIVCPCCNGAMTSQSTCGYTYPRSVHIQSMYTQDEYLEGLCRAADNDTNVDNYSAKCIIQYDRAVWGKENGYRSVRLLKLSPPDCTPKHHVLYLSNLEE